MISNKNFIDYKVLDLVELYNFDINFCLYPTSFKKDMNLFVLHLFLRTVDLANRLWKSIFRGGCLKRTVSENHLLSEMVDISNHPWK
jgi:hypothetical protein